MYILFTDVPSQPGLQYRLNAITGKAEAKWMETYKPPGALAVVPSETEGNKDAGNEKSVSDLKERLQNIPADEIATTTEVCLLSLQFFLIVGMCFLSFFYGAINLQDFCVTFCQ